MLFRSKRKPLHLVFYAQLEESTSIIAGIHLCRIAGRRMGRGDEGCVKRRAGTEGQKDERTHPGRIGVSTGPCDEATRAERVQQGAEMVQVRWKGVGGVENLGEVSDSSAFLSYAAVACAFSAARGVKRTPGVFEGVKFCTLRRDLARRELRGWD